MGGRLQSGGAQGWCSAGGTGGSRSRPPSSPTSPRAWLWSARSCPTRPPSGPGRTSSSATPAAAGTRWTCCSSGRGRLHLIELKYYSGTLRGDDQRWARDGRRPEDSPLKLARRKAQYFATKLRDELRLWAQQQNTRIPDERDVVPFVQESVFLHHPDLRCLLSESSAIGLYGIDGNSSRSNLPGISDLVLEGAGRRAIGRNQELILVQLMERIGLVQRREREAGSWVIEDQAIDSGEGWQDWLASHRVAGQDRARIRFRVLPPTASQQEKASARQIAEHEFRVMSRLHHDGLLRPRDLVESELGVGLVYPYDPQWQRLDLWRAGQANGVPLVTQLSMIRQVGEALQYAHNNRVVHRGLSPLAVWVRSVPGTAQDVKVRIGDWQGAGMVPGATGTHRATTGVTALAPDAPSDDDAGLAEAFAAPEGAWSADADRVRLDVFGLGALAFFLLTGRPPATSGTGAQAAPARPAGPGPGDRAAAGLVHPAVGGAQGDEPGAVAAHRGRPDRARPARRRGTGDRLGRRGDRPARRRPGHCPGRTVHPAATPRPGVDRGRAAGAGRARRGRGRRTCPQGGSRRPGRGPLGRRG